MNANRAKPSLFDYLDYRAYLRAAFEAKKQKDTAFSYRVLAREAGFASAGSLKLAIDGRRGLSEEKARDLAAALGLKGDESDYFCFLAAFGTAKTDEARNRALGRMRAIRRFRDVKKVELARYEYFRHWHHLAIREMVNLEDFREDAEWIARRLLFTLTPRDVTRTIVKLEKLGFLVRDADGRLKQAEPVAHTEVEIEAEFASLIAKNFHREMMQRAAEALEKVPAAKRDVRALTVAISRGQAERIKQMNIQHMKDVLDVVLEDEPVEAVYQLNLQWFPLTAAEPAEAGDAAPGKE
ncbi:MAG: TIGR02147 family protein [Myxococcales bacterium]|nr:MAG: TIGR02147 family protein [Myxococcales bacterium]